MLIFTETPLLHPDVPSNPPQLVQLLFDWINTSTLLEIRSVALICQAARPFVSEIVYSHFGSKMYQFAVGVMTARGPQGSDVNGDATAQTIQLSDGITCTHYLDMKVLPSRLVVNAASNAALLRHHIASIPPRKGDGNDANLSGAYGVLRTWVDNTRAEYEWKLVGSTTAARDASLLIGPVLGTMQLDTTAGSNNPTLWLPILLETDVDTVISIEMIHVFTSEVSEVKFEVKCFTPTVCRLGPLFINTRYSFCFTSGISSPDSHKFSTSTFYSESESNYAFINCSRPVSNTDGSPLLSSYDFTFDLQCRFNVPFHGISTLFHLNAGIDIMRLSRLVAIVEGGRLELSNACRRACAIEVDRIGQVDEKEEGGGVGASVGLDLTIKKPLTDLIASVRKYLRDELEQPSYKALLRCAFNQFILIESNIDAALEGKWNQAMRDGELIHLLLRVIVALVHDTYFGILNATSALNDSSTISSVNSYKDLEASVFSQWVRHARRLLTVRAPLSTTRSSNVDSESGLDKAPCMHVCVSANKMIHVETIDLSSSTIDDNNTAHTGIIRDEDSRLAACLSHISTADVKSRIRVIIIQSMHASSSSAVSTAGVREPALELLDANTQLGYRFQGALKAWMKSNPGHKVLLLTPTIHKDGTCVKDLPIEDETITGFSIHFIDSMYRSNRSTLDVRIAEIVRNFEAKSGGSSGVRKGKKTVNTEQKVREKTRLLDELVARKSAEIRDTLPTDGYLFVECRYINMSSFDIKMDYILSCDVNIKSSVAILSKDDHFDYLQPPNWLSLFIPHEAGVFIIDEVIFTARNNVSNQQALLSIEGLAMRASITDLYIRSRLHAMVEYVASRVDMDSLTVFGIEAAVVEFMHDIWTSLLPSEYKQVCAYLPDAFVLNYCLCGARFMESLLQDSSSSADDNQYDHVGGVVSAIQLALVHAVCIKTCTSMDNVRQWRASLFTSSVRDIGAERPADGRDVDDDGGLESDVADLERADGAPLLGVDGDEGGLGVASPLTSPVSPKAKRLSFTDKQREEEEEDGAGKLARVGAEVERRRTGRLERLRHIGAALKYVGGYSLAKDA